MAMDLWSRRLTKSVVPTNHVTSLDEPVLFLATANAERSRAFYERVLGLDFVADEPPALVLALCGPSR
jgi:hypothetical protein